MPPLRTTALRQANLSRLARLGFRVAPSLPIARENDHLRPAIEIAARLMALDAIFAWVVLSEQQTPSDMLRAHVARDDLEAWMTEDELPVWRKPKAQAYTEHVDTIGWKLENLWALAWVLGFDPAPSVSGEVLAQKTIAALLIDFAPTLDEGLDAFLARHEVRSEAEVIAMEDLFYCAHNATRSAQFGRRTVPEGFDPIMGVGVIHERRHALTWCLSPGVAWDETDLSTQTAVIYACEQSRGRRSERLHP